MRIFVTGASGWIGSASVRELVEAGHQVVGLARSVASAAIVAGLGAEVRRGDLDDLDSLRAGAEDAEAVVHLGYNHDFAQMGAAAATDRAAIDAMGEPLAASGGALLIASGTLGLTSGRAATERDGADPQTHPRIANATATLALADRGVRSMVVRFAPTVHGEGDHGFTKVLADIARDRHLAGYIGDGSNRWPAVHRSDAARLVRSAIEAAPARSVLHAVGEEGVTAKEIATAIGTKLGVPVASVPAEQVQQHFGWIGAFFAADCPATHQLTTELLGWQPTGPTLLEDLEAGYYTAG